MFNVEILAVAVVVSCFAAKDLPDNLINIEDNQQLCYQLSSPLSEVSWPVVMSHDEEVQPNIAWCISTKDNQKKYPVLIAKTVI